MGPENSFADAHYRARKNHVLRLRQAELEGSPLTDRDIDEIEQELFGSVDESAKQARRGRPPKSEESEG